MHHRSAISREALIQAIQPVDGHFLTLKAIGDPYDRTRERVRQRLDEEKLVKPRVTLLRKAKVGDIVVIQEDYRWKRHRGHQGPVVEVGRFPAKGTMYLVQCECGQPLRLAPTAFTVLLRSP